MADTPKITDDVAILCKKYLEDVALGVISVSDKFEWNRFTAAKALYTAYQTQEKFGAARIRELSHLPKPSQNVRDYEALTDEDLNDKVVAIRGGRKTG